MIRNKTPMYECNDSASLFVPSPPTDNLALQSTSVPNQQYDGVTIEQMRENPEIFDKNLSGLDKQSVLEHKLRTLAPSVKETAKNMTALQKKLKR